MSDSLLSGSFDDLNELFESHFIIQLMLAGSLKEEACQWRSSVELPAHRRLSSPNLPKLRQVIGHPQVCPALVIITFGNCRCRSGRAPTAPRHVRVTVIIELYSHQEKHSHGPPPDIPTHHTATGPPRSTRCNDARQSQGLRTPVKVRICLLRYTPLWLILITLVLFDSMCRTKNDLTKQLAELKHDLLTLRVQKIAGGSAAKLTKMFVSPSPPRTRLEMGKC